MPLPLFLAKFYDTGWACPEASCPPVNLSNTRSMTLSWPCPQCVCNFSLLDYDIKLSMLRKCLPLRHFSIGIYLGSHIEGIVWETTQMPSVPVTVITHFSILPCLGHVCFGFIVIKNSHPLYVVAVRCRCCSLDLGFYCPWQWVRALHHRCLSFTYVLASGKVN